MTLPEPFALPEPAREWVDVSPTPWREGALPDDTGRSPMKVPRQVAVYVHQQKALAGATVATDFKQVGTLLAKLTKETAPARNDRARMDTDVAAAKAAGASPAHITAIEGLQLGPRQETHAQLQAAVERAVQPVRNALFDAERA